MSEFRLISPGEEETEKEMEMILEQGIKKLEWLKTVKTYRTDSSQSLEWKAYYLQNPSRSSSQQRITQPNLTPKWTWTWRRL